MPAAEEALPEYERQEVAKHRSSADGGRVWVTYKDGVYDITDFVENHPGGAKRIMLAAGGAIDPFWSMYQQHNTAQARPWAGGWGGWAALPAGSWRRVLRGEMGWEEVW